MSDKWQQLIITLEGCDPAQLRDKTKMQSLISRILKVGDMKRLGESVFREIEESKESIEQGIDGITIIQVIRTSNITIHCIPSRSRCYFDMFSCKQFDSSAVLSLVYKHFKAKSVAVHNILR